MSKALLGSLLVFTLALPLVGCNKAPPATSATATPAAMPAPADSKPPHPMPVPDAASVDVSGIAKAEGGMMVAEVFAGREQLAGKPVTLRGKVVKSNAGIMGKNWIHVRDGSGAEGANDLTVTTLTAQPNVGDTVLITGLVSLNKDFGMGYQYDVIVEDAEVTIESAAATL